MVQYENLAIQEFGAIRLIDRLLPVGFSEGPHVHEHPYFTLVLSGELSEIEESGRQDYGVNCVAYKPPGIHSSFVGDQQAHLFLIGAQRALLDDCEAGTYGHEMVERQGQLVALAKRAYSEFTSRDPFSSLAMQGLVLEMLAIAARVAPYDGREPAWIAKVDELVRYSYSLTMSQVAKEVGVHPVTLSRAYRKFRHRSLGEAMRQSKIESAKSLLSSKGSSLGEIAVDLGFSDQSHFTKTFKRAVGMTPGRYRELRSK